MTDELDIEEEEEEDEQRPFNSLYFRRMMRYLKPYRRQVLLGATMMLTVMAAGLMEPLIIKTAIDDAIAPGELNYLDRLVLALVGLRIVAWLAQRAQIRIMNHTGQSILYDLRQQLFEHVQKLSLSFYDGRPVGKIMSRITNDVNAIAELVNSGVINLISQGVSLVAITAILLIMNPRLALTAFTVLPAIGYLALRVRTRMSNAWMNTRKAYSSINAHLNETVTGIQEIQVFNRQGRQSERFRRINQRLKKAFMTAIRYEMVLWPGVDLVGVIGMCLVIWVGARQVIQGALTIGVLLAFVQYINRFFAPLSTMSRVYSQVLSAMASAERVFEILDTEPLVYDREGAVDLPKIKGEIVFENVSFAYKEGEPVLRDMNLRIEPGQMVALVGPTGGGKSTIANLVCRFYDPTEGRVLVDGYDLTKVTLSSVRSQLGLVLQDTFIFSGKIRDNIAYGRLDAPLEDIMEAARAVKADDFIQKLSDNYDHEITERGASLSTGQRQLLAFARALLANPRILILDEATAHIDIATERAIQEALERLLVDRTSIVIAHRLSTIEKADLILFIDGGRIVEQGNHRELLARKGRYWQLYTTQYRLERDVALESSLAAGQVG